MKNKIIAFVVTVCALAVIVLCFCMPSLMAKATDAQTIGVSNSIDVEPISIESADEMDAINKLLLFSSSPSITELSKGKNLDEESALTAAKVAIEPYLSVMPDFNADNCEVFYNIYFLIDPEEPTQSMVVWGINLIDKELGHAAYLIIDDETGTLFSIEYYPGDINMFIESYEISVMENGGEISTWSQSMFDIFASSLGLEVASRSASAATNSESVYAPGTIVYDKNSYSSYSFVTDGIDSATIRLFFYEHGFSVAVAE